MNKTYVRNSVNTYRSVRELADTSHLEASSNRPQSGNASQSGGRDARKNEQSFREILARKLKAA